MKKVDLSVDLCGIKLKNPTILASGFMGISNASLSFVEKSGAGAITTKSIGHIERTGHNNPTVLSWGQGLINAVGLSNQGIDQSLPMLKEILKTAKIPAIVSFFADTIANFTIVSEKILSLKPLFIEVNASCPNTQCDLGTAFSLDTEMLKALVISIRKKVKNRTKVIVKLAPNVPNIALMGKITEDAGADAICAINTVPGMIIDIYSRKPILTNKTGGISGKAIKPIAVKAIFDLYKAVKIPIIGLGGIENGEDALEMIMAGATAVGIGSAIYARGIDVFSKVTNEMQDIMVKEGVKTLSEIRGAAHD